MTVDEMAWRIDMIQERIGRACERAGRDEAEVTLLPVTKTYGPETVAMANECGLRSFGENRVQEAKQKIPKCPGGLDWHLIGHLQTNKVKDAVRMFSTVHSVDSLRLLEALNSAREAVGTPVKVFLEVNVSGEGSKYGLVPDETEVVLEGAFSCSYIDVGGLMTIPPFTDDPEDARPVFAELRQLRDSLQERTGAGLPDLSMGMSNDFEAAIEEGATWVRLGTTLFGTRYGDKNG